VSKLPPLLAQKKAPLRDFRTGELSPKGLKTRKD